MNHSPHDPFDNPDRSSTRARSLLPALVATVLVLGLAQLGAGPLGFVPAALAQGALGQGELELGLSVDIVVELDLTDATADQPATPSPVKAITPDGDPVASLSLEDEAGATTLRGTLPDLAGSPLLASITSEELWPCPLEVSDAGASFLPVSFLVDGIGTLEISAQTPTRSPLPGHVAYVFVYADVAVTASGECPGLGVDIELAPGWNLLAGELDVGDHVLLRNATPDEQRLARWYFTPQHGAPQPSEQDVRPERP